MLNEYKALILAIIEGFTEFLPISSTAHLVFASNLLEFNIIPNYSFEIIIQFAAILPLFIIYRVELFTPLLGLKQKENRDFYLKFLIALMPIIIIGGIFGDVIKAKIFDLNIISASLIVGGLIMIFIDKILAKPQIHELKDVNFKKSMTIGMFQILALLPGMSRAGSTIIGGMFIGLNRETSAKFSFFLAIPTILAATTYDLVKNYDNLTFDSSMILLLGFVASFIVAYIVIWNFNKIISNLGFRVLGIYRVILGMVIICGQYLG
ncbi:MAG: undecaprenyl-diphosphate phosphatase [Rickettsiales bacterium]|jgi:undecaprenyl-diphosphatase|nr:undecaprenyl-diphosphate phosphatase [Rickettsiales bacterium]